MNIEATTQGTPTYKYKTLQQSKNAKDVRDRETLPNTPEEEPKVSKDVRMT